MQRSNAVRLAIVDDEPDIRGIIADYFVKDGYAVSRCSCAAELDLILTSGPADLVILDISLPGEDGFSIARRLRATTGTPIIMLTGMDGVVDRVVGLEMGADDYVTKPFDLRELKARVRAVLRRTGAARPDASAAPVPAASGKRVCFGKVCLDLERRVLIDEDGTEIRLTATEFDLLATFARNPNRVLSRDRLLDTAPGRDDNPFDRSIDIRVTRIRKKVEVDPAKPQIIRTVRSVGYIYVPPRAAA
ncbi:MAG: response regulator transcription factor [Rhizobiaceae bacterium]|nr:MAG: response regulator transcription factor [Rhizobiaceae bacterium]CAG0984923.1 Transcriptional regulatory protein OmpR [Rhizobiaceae bacterium]